MIKKILVCTLGLLITMLLTGCPQASAHPTEEAGVSVISAGINW